MLSESETVRILLRDRIQILSYIDSFLQDTASAEDCYQEACVAAVAKGDYFEDETHVFRWALRVGRNKAVDICRKRSRDPVILDEDVLDMLEAHWDSQHDPHLVPQAELTAQLKKCIASLTDASQRIIHLRYVDGMKTGRIAELMGRKVATVYQTITRAHSTLRNCMEEKTSSHEIQKTQ